jgi:DNA-binding SARP family transcriptional activator
MLASVFWPDCTREASLKALRNTLWRLRQMLHTVGVPEEQYLAAGEDRVAFDATSQYWLDIEAFEQGIQQTKKQPGTLLSAEQADQLEKAVSLYSGDLLEGVYQDWCLVERERLRTLYLNTLSALMSYHEAHANYERGLAHGEAMLLKDNTREVVHRKMMRLYWLSGNRSAALAQYHRCVHILGDELGVAPMAQTQSLYEAMCHDRVPQSGAAGPATPPVSDNGHTVESSCTLVQDIIQRVQRLQAVLSETTGELERLQRLLVDINS